MLFLTAMRHSGGELVQVKNAIKIRECYESCAKLKPRFSRIKMSGKSGNFPENLATMLTFQSSIILIASEVVNVEAHAQDPLKNIDPCKRFGLCPLSCTGK